MDKLYEDVARGASHTSPSYRMRTGGRRLIDQVQMGQRHVISPAVRILFYVALSALTFQALDVMVQDQESESIVAENGIMEWLQIALLVSCSVLLAICARQMPMLSEGFAALAILPLMASVREMDQILDQHVFDGAWQGIVSLLLAYLIFVVWKHGFFLKQQILRILAAAPAGILLSAFLAVVFSRLFGRQAFWEAALQEHYLRLVARIVEEGSELFAYLLLLFGCIEFLIFALSCKGDRHNGDIKAPVRSRR